MSIIHSLIKREFSNTSLRPTFSAPLLSLPLSSTLPFYALQSGHIVLGFDPSDRFILTYTIRPTSNNQFDDLFTYKLYFWEFIPNSVAKKYSSVMLFDRGGIGDFNLLIEVCGWGERDMGEWFVVVGRSTSPEDSPRCYLTISKYKKNSPTFNINYDLVSPYPKFDWTHSLTITEAQTPTILINTGNLIHSIQLNPKKTKKKKNKLKVQLQKNNDLENLFKQLVPRKTVEKKFFKRSQRVLQKNQKIVPIGTIYDQFPEEEKLQNYKIFRNKQLADKRYEFVDENFEKVPKKKKKEEVYFKNSTVQLIRSYLVSNEESVSTCTSVEDVFDNFSLNLFVCLDRGLREERLGNVGEKVVDEKIVVCQNSLDLEIICNEVGSLVCEREGVGFGGLVDFDGCVVENDPTKNTITLLVVIQIKTNSMEFNESPFFSSTYMLQWNCFKQSCRIVFDNLKKINTNTGSSIWNPTGSLRVEKLRVYRGGGMRLDNFEMVYSGNSLSQLKTHSGTVALYRELEINEDF